MVVNGHMHSGCFKTYTFPWGTKYTYISSDQRQRFYIIVNMDSDDIEVEVRRDNDKISGFKV